MKSMLSKRKLLNSSKLYLILDAEVNSYDQLFDIAETAVENGINIFQLRDKQGSGREILEFSRRFSQLLNNRAIYIINDYVDLAMAGFADGVHLGQDDCSLKEARNIMGEEAVIGISCQTYEDAVKAQEQGADYIGFGSVFKTLTKPQRNPMNLELLKKVINHIEIPVFAIGGIHLENVSQLTAIGVKRLAVCRAIAQVEDIAGTIQRFEERIDSRIPISSY